MPRKAGSDSPAPPAKTEIQNWKDAEAEAINEAYSFNPTMTQGEIMGRFMNVRLLDWKGIDEVRQDLGLSPMNPENRRT